MHSLSCDCDACWGDYRPHTDERVIICTCECCSEPVYDIDLMEKGRAGNIIHARCWATCAICGDFLGDALAEWVEYDSGWSRAHYACEHNEAQP